ncbi:helix-turn-helix domain-containing protein [Poritiphilus flavus]|uniref:Helix-turn-helix domain-containing protein n=1 Tax=Poritiphilus flavus TaxID=2697053 RepID=A0A6L9EIF8_9FLAO|nr:AraC family transcriptional regulator [Poritiphilus flavus]NAS14445.1 helix-turn-helix domain-containing protein [Poritiphilus flavus]
MEQVLQLFFSIGILQALLLGAVLFFYSGKGNMAPRLIALLLLLLVALMFSEFLELFGISPDNFPVLQYAILIDLIFGPILLLAARFFLNRQTAFGKKDGLHLLPVCIGLVWYFTGLRNTNASFGTIPDSVAILVLLKIAFVSIYTIWILREIRSAESLRKEGSSDRINFLKHIVWPFVVISLVSLLAFWVNYFGLEFALDSDMLGIILITIFIYLLSFNTLRRPHVLIPTASLRVLPKYSKSGLGEHKKEQLLLSLKDYLESEKPYLDENISLSELSRKFSIPPNQLSQAINEGLGLNFYQLINQYRLREVKRKLSDPEEDHKTILALAFESGFQSKASFNRIFKQSEKTTPAEFRKNNRS